MPRLTVWFLRAAIVHMLVGFTLGALLLIHKGTAGLPWMWRFLSVHVDMLLLGWMSQLAMGVAFWILPRFGTRRGVVWLAWVAWVAVNLGVGMVFVAAWMRPPQWVWVVARTLEVGGVVAFVMHAWPRVKPALVAAERQSG